MAAPKLTKEDVVEMMWLLDRDGDNEVSKDEFFKFCCEVSKPPLCAEADFPRMWKKIDSNGDGSLQFNELCAYFGVDAEDAAKEADAAKNLDEEEVWEALRVQEALHSAKEKIKKDEDEKKKKALTRRTASGARAGVDIIKNAGGKTDSTDEGKLLEASEMVEPASDRKVMEELLGKVGGSVPTWIEPNDVKVNVRVEGNDKSEMPLHKLARTFEHTLIARILKITEAKHGVDAKRADVNSQNKDGKPPLFLAVEGRLDILEGYKRLDVSEAERQQKIDAYRDNQFKTVSVLLTHGADVYIESALGWNVMHAAAHGGCIEAAKEIFSYLERMSFSTLQMNTFVNHRDKDGRTPLHIAGMRADPDIAYPPGPPFPKLLMSKGADNSIADYCAKITPSALASKAGRRASKELMEDMESEKASNIKSYHHRRRSMSRELPVMPPN